MTKTFFAGLMPPQVITTDGSNNGGVAFQFTTAEAFDMNGSSRIRNLPNAVENDEPVTYEQLLMAASGLPQKTGLLDNKQLNTNWGIVAATAVWLVDGVYQQGDFITMVTSTIATQNITINVSGNGVAQDMQDLSDDIQQFSNFSSEYLPNLTDFNADGVILIQPKTGIGTAGSAAATTEDIKLRVWGTRQDSISIVSFCALTRTGTETEKSANYNNTDKKAVFLNGTSNPGPSVDYSGVASNLGSIVEGQTHWIGNSNERYTWDADSEAWIQSGGGSSPDGTAASGGGTKGLLSADSDKGLDVSNGVLSAKIDEANSSGSIEFDGSGRLSTKLGSTEQDSTISRDSSDNGLRVKHSATSGLSADSDGLNVAVDGSTVSRDSGSLEVLYSTSGGLFVDSQGLEIKTDGGTSLQVNSNDELEIAVPLVRKEVERITLNAANISNRKADLSAAAADPSVAEMYFENDSGQVAPPQENGVEFSIVDDGGGFSVLTWSPTYAPANSGSAPTTGMVGDLLANYVLVVSYEKTEYTPQN